MILRQFLFCACLWTTIITGSVLLGLSFERIQLQEYAILHNTVSQEIDNDVLTAGRHFVGLGRKAIRFPRNQFTIEFSADKEADMISLSAWTNDGLNVYIDAMIFVVLDPAKIIELYKSFSENYYSALVRTAYGALKDVTTNFQTSDYFNRRNEISELMKNEIQKRLRQISFEGIVEDAITAKLVQQQKVLTAKQEQQLKLANKQTEIIANNAENQIIRLNAVNQGQASYIVEKQKADNFANLVSSHTSEYVTLAINAGCDGAQTPSTYGVNNILLLMYSLDFQSLKTEPVFNLNDIYVPK